jgi:hypothetical protein
MPCDGSEVLQSTNIPDKDICTQTATVWPLQCKQAAVEGTEHLQQQHDCGWFLASSLFLCLSHWVWSAVPESTLCFSKPTPTGTIKAHPKAVHNGAAFLRTYC